jgi:hypothetical protein
VTASSDRKSTKRQRALGAATGSTPQP